MKRYIRTKDNKIYDTTKYNINYDDVYTSEIFLIFLIFLRLKTDEAKGWVINKENIVKESDNILDLIDYDNDLFEYANNMWSAKHLIDADNFNENYINKLYTKQENNYVLVWTRERGVI